MVVKEAETGLTDSTWTESGGIAALDMRRDAGPLAHNVVAVIPAYNEERFIASVVITASQHARHVIVVNDGSSDRTALLANLAGAEVVDLPQNVGKGRALTAGFERAWRLDPDVVVMLDGDAQHDPAEIPRVVAPVLEGEADVVIGSRFLQSNSGIPRWRRFGQHVLTRLSNIGSGLKTTDSQSGFRAFSPAAFYTLEFHSRGLAMESEMQFLLQGTPLRVTEVPISVQYLDGNKRNPVVHGLQVLDTVLNLVARRRPLLFIGVPGLLLTVAGLALSVSVLEVVDTHQVVPYGRVAVSAILVIIGLLLGVSAVILNSLEHVITRVRDELDSALREFSRSPDHRVMTYGLHSSSYGETDDSALASRSGSWSGGEGSGAHIQREPPR